ncbi:MAG: hypothetical protein C5B50_19390 [Verrucomicrobia bacterium]|nr:MAG: hypothetical protein C5B50_19390 [Verrucomicrobiota bacterium]
MVQAGNCQKACPRALANGELSFLSGFDAEWPLGTGERRTTYCSAVASAMARTSNASIVALKLSAPAANQSQRPMTVKILEFIQNFIQVFIPSPYSDAYCFFVF